MQKERNLFNLCFEMEYINYLDKIYIILTGLFYGVGKIRIKGK